MAQLDEISLTLGKIQASVEYTAKWIEKKEERDEERYEMISCQLDDTKALLKRVETFEKEMLPIKAYIELAKVREYKLAGALVVIGGLVSVVGTVLFLAWQSMSRYFG